MTATNETPAAPPEPPETQWVPAPEPEPVTTRNRSESDGDDGDRGHPVGHWIAGGAGSAGLGAAELWHAFGPLGLIAGGVTAAVPAAAYGAYKLRGDGKGRSRSPFSKGGGGRKSTARMGSVGLGKGKSPKLFGGKGAKLGGGKGPKLGKGGGPKLGGKGGPKLGKGSGPSLGGKAGKLGGGKSKLFGGGRGSSLGGKLGKGRTGAGGRTATGKTGGARSSSPAGGGRPAKTRLGRAMQSAGRRIAATPAGRRAARAVQAAKSAAAGTPGRRWGLRRFRSAKWGARQKLPRGKTWLGRRWWSAVAAFLALGALIHDWWRDKHPRKDDEEVTDTENETESDGKPKAEEKAPPKPRHCDLCGNEIAAGQDNEIVMEGVPVTVCPTCFKPNDKRRHPDTSENPNEPRRKPTMSNQFPLADAAEQVEAAAGRYWPQTMWHVDQDLEQIHMLPEAIANAVQAYTQSLQAAYPIDRVVIEALFRMYTALGQVAVSCMEIPKLFKDVHAEDIKRRTAPRTGEDKWNV